MCSCCTAVGLSYSTHHRDYNTHDTATAADSHAFLRAFFKRYPHLQHNDIYIAGQRQQQPNLLRQTGIMSLAQFFVPLLWTSQVSWACLQA